MRASVALVQVVDRFSSIGISFVTVLLLNVCYRCWVIRTIEVSLQVVFAARTNLVQDLVPNFRPFGFLHDSE